MTSERPPSPTADPANGFQPSMTKEQINGLPLQRCELPVTLVSKAEQEAAALEALNGQRILGFDTETRPAFKKGESYLPSLVQLASEDHVAIFQISQTGLTPGLVGLLADASVLKVGVGLDHEIVTLKKMADFEPAGFIELGPMADKVGVEANGLRNLTACVLGFRISKRAQLSNWSRKRLTEDQLVYAATDAWVSREIYLRLQGAGAA